jgi:uncharacterized protein YuzE
LRKPETFDFLGFTHICGKTRKGRFALRRLTVKKRDALYLGLGDQSPDGGIESAAGVNLDTTSDGKIVGIEILDASNRMDIKTILSCTLDLEHGLSRLRAA